jgi:replicative DNA helicase
MVRALEEGIVVTADEQRIKIPPNSIEAEQSLIGGLMLDAQAWDKIADVVAAEDFYRRDHQLIFAAIANLVEAGSPCDVVTVSEYLDKRGELEAAGSLEYLATLANETPGAANARAYARILRDRASNVRSFTSATRSPATRLQPTGGRRRSSSTRRSAWSSR